MRYQITTLFQSYAFTSDRVKAALAVCLLASSMMVLSAISVASAGSFKDGHIHYNQDMWEMLPPDRAIHMLKEAEIERALVGSTPTLGTEMLYREDSRLVVPIMMPYKDYRHRFYWFKDPQLIDYLREQLARVPYVGFGEFHIFGDDMDSEPVAQMISLAREKQLVLQPHTDLPGMQILLNKAPDLMCRLTRSNHCSIVTLN